MQRRWSLALLQVEQDAPTERVHIDSVGNFKPGTDNGYSMGASGRRWTAIHATNGTIQTSDQRDKTEIETSVLGTDFIKSLRPVSYKWKVGQNIVSKDEDGETDVITPLKMVFVVIGDLLPKK